MKFTNTLLKGKLQRRYKRFFTDIEVNNKIYLVDIDYKWKIN